MTKYLFKLARRLAFAHVALASLALLACSEPEPREFLGTEPGSPTSPLLPVSLHIAQHPGSVAHNQFMRFAAWGRNGVGDSIAVPVSWTASAGEIGPDGTFRATAAGRQVITAFATNRPSVKASTSLVVGDPGSIFTGLKVLPELVAVYGGSAVNFAATAKLSATGVTTAPAVTWSTDGGSMTPQGAFVATSVPGEYQVTAVTADGKLTGVAKVTVKAAELLKIRVLPKAVVISGGGTQDFSVSATWSDGSTVVPVLAWQSAAGTIVHLPAMQDAPGGTGNGGGGGGRLTGGTTPGTYAVIARHPHSGRADTATVTILPTLAEIQLAPGTLSLVSGASATFSVTGVMTDGSTVTVPVSWQATGGQISGSGVYLAGPQAGTFRVIVIGGGGVADTAVVQISQPVASLSSLVIQPGGGSVATGATMQFTAQGIWADGSTAQPSVSWFADGGSISPDGRWTAPAMAGTVRVRVVESGGTKADTAVMTVQQAGPTLASLSISPKTAAITGGQSVTFAAAATWTDGGASVPPLVWSATGGTMGQDGTWQAPVNYPGTYKVVAKHSGSTLADTATVQVSEVPHVTRIDVSPSAAATVPQGTVQFVGTATWSDGQQRSVGFIWQATGGSISMQGLFRAGSLAGQFLVIAGCTGCAVTDTVEVTISEPVQASLPSLTQLVLNPSSFTVEPGQARSLSLAATWSDGSTTVPPVSWDVTGGTVAGLVYTAGSTAGTYRLIVRHQGGTRADTSAVMIQANAGPPTGSAEDLVVFPNAEIAFIIGPQLKSGAASNPWPWYDQNAVARGLVHGAAFPATAPTSNLDAYDRFVLQNYYDLGLTLYTAFYRTGDTRFRDHARKVADAWWTAGQIGSGTTHPQSSFAPRNVSLGGLILRAMDGRPEMWPWIVTYTRSEFEAWLGARLNSPSLWYGVRDGAFMLLHAAWLAKTHPDPAIRAEFTTKARDAARLYYLRLQQPDGGWYWYIDYAGNQEASQPFMIGLLQEGLIAVHRLTADPDVGDAIVKSVGWMYSKAYEQQATSNLPNVHWRAMRYFVVKSNFEYWTRTTAVMYGMADGAIRDERQLNSTTLHAFGYAYKITGDPKYRTWGDEVFAATFGRGQGPGADAYYNLADFREKEYNQSYRASGRYLAWRAGH